eukprot:6786210-Pyramimonas_sp.AAC.1
MGEWPTLGLPSVNSFHHPCPCCNATKATMYKGYVECSLASLPWEERSDEFYGQECDRCEIRIWVGSEDVRSTLISVGKPVYTKGKLTRGRALSEPIPAYGLQAGDRIEQSYDVRRPGKVLIDPAALETQHLPFEVVFWRARFDARQRCTDPVHRRNPLFDLLSLGTSPARSLALDSLHLLYLGVLGRFVSAVLWRITLDNPWGCDATTQEAILDQATSE